MSTASCHCGNVRIKLASRPSAVTECNCSLCYRYGVLWAYFTNGTVEITISQTESVNGYVRHDSGATGNIAFNICTACGCMTHWYGLAHKNIAQLQGPGGMVGINCRMIPREDLEGVARQVSDGPR